MREMVIGVGLPKTGTKSLNEALKILGYRAVHYPTKYNWKIMTEGKYEIPKEWDAITNTAEEFYPVLARMYPDAKFILTTRNLDDWLCSWGKKDRPFSSQTELGRLNRVRIFGTARYVPEKFKHVFVEHEKKVREFFRKEPQRLLLIRLEDEDKWKLLCDFLGKPRPDTPFPHVKKKVDKS